MPKVQRQAAYAVCEGISPQDLAQKVQMMLGQGFMPAGGIVAAQGPGIAGPAGLLFYQAMVFIHDTPLPEGEEPKQDGPGPRLVAT